MQRDLDCRVVIRCDEGMKVEVSETPMTKMKVCSNMKMAMVMRACIDFYDVRMFCMKLVVNKYTFCAKVVYEAAKEKVIGVLSVV